MDKIYLELSTFEEFATAVLQAVAIQEMFVTARDLFFFKHVNETIIRRLCIHALGDSCGSSTVCSTAVANPSKVPRSRQIFSMRLILHLAVELFSVTYLGLYPARKCETRQTCKQTVKQLSQRQRFTRFVIT